MRLDERHPRGCRSPDPLKRSPHIRRIPLCPPREFSLVACDPRARRRQLRSDTGLIMTDPSASDPRPVPATDTPSPSDGVGDGPTMNFLPFAEDEGEVGTRVWSAETEAGVLQTAPAAANIQIPGYEVLEKL